MWEAPNAVTLSVALERGADEVNLCVADVFADDVFHWPECGETDLGEGVGDAAIVVIGHEGRYINRFAFGKELTEVVGDDAQRQVSRGGYLLHA